MIMALAILEKLKERDRAKRTVRVGRRIAGKKMTPELARRIIELNQTTDMTQQEIAFQLGVNQGRVNEVLKRGKWLEDNPASEEAVARDRAKARIKKAKAESVTVSRRRTAGPPEETPSRSQVKPRNSSQLSIEDFINSAMAPDGNQSH